MRLLTTSQYFQPLLWAINHAPRFTVDQAQNTFLWPARHTASSSSDPNLPPMGLRLRLKAGVNISYHYSFTRPFTNGNREFVLGVSSVYLCQFVADVAFRHCSIRYRTFLESRCSLYIEYGQTLRGSACPHLRAPLIHLKYHPK